MARVLELQVATAEVEREWVARLVEEIRDGGLAFAGEPMAWQPAPDDPGWQMHHDRLRYRELLGAVSGPADDFLSVPGSVLEQSG